MYFRKHKSRTIRFPGEAKVVQCEACRPSPPSRPRVPRPRHGRQVFSLIRDGRALTRSDVGRLTGLSRTAVAARLTALLGSGLVVEGADGVDGDRSPSTGGRPAVQLRFNRDAGVVLAGAIGRSRTQLGVCDLDGCGAGLPGPRPGGRSAGAGPDAAGGRGVPVAARRGGRGPRTPYAPSGCRSPAPWTSSAGPAWTRRS